MKQLKPGRLMAFAFMLFCTVSSYMATAKVQVAASNPDNALPIGVGVNNFQQVYSLNCDMVDCSAPGKLLAVAVQGSYAAAPLQRAGLYIEYQGVNPVSRTILLPNTATDVDVVISDDMGGTTGQDYLVTVIYVDNGTNIVTETYSVKSLGSISGTISATPVGGPVLLTSGGNYSHAHIDMFGDRSATSFGSHKALYEYAAVWDENIAGTYSITFTTGSIDNVSGAITNIAPTTISLASGYSSARNPDVAAQTVLTPVGSPYHDKTVWVTYANASSTGFALTEVRINSVGTVTYPSMPVLKSGTISYVPRIEAQALIDLASPGGPMYAAIASDPGTIESTTIYTDLGTRNIPGFASGTFMAYPVITGVGAQMSGGTGLGTNHYTAMFWTNDTWAGGGPAGGVYYTNSYDMATSFLGTYKQVNRSALLASKAVTFGDNACAAANSSNSGDDIFVVWYCGQTAGTGLINYKLGGNSPAYKSTTNVTPITQDQFKVYPNPATDFITVEAKGNTAYAVTDVLGKVVASGNITNGRGGINASQLANGTYILQLSNSTGKHTVQFIKN